MGKFYRAIDEIADILPYPNIDVIVCIDARGFLIGGALAYKTAAVLFPIRKKGKLPWLVTGNLYWSTSGHPGNSSGCHFNPAKMS